MDEATKKPAKPAKHVAAKEKPAAKVSGKSSGKPSSPKELPADAATAKLADAGPVNARPANGKAAHEPAPERPAAQTAPSQAESKVDIETLARNLARLVEESGKAIAAYMKPREEGQIKTDNAESFADMVKSVGKVAEYWLSDPSRALELQTGLGRSYLDLWATTVKRMAGEEQPPVVTPDPSDRRFNDPEWTSNQFFDFMKQAYLLTAQWANHLVTNAEGVDPHTRHKAEFYVKQMVNALAPTNFVLTNPELLRETLTSNADNLVRGMHMLTEDIKAGRGNLKIRQSDGSAFKVGENLATTPGKVIFQNDLIQLIQYEAATKDVLKVPLLIVPPWINKFYILDLAPDKSFIKWCADQGLTVFVVSWVNPDARQAAKSFEEYMKEGILTAMDVVEEVTGEKHLHVLGYCVGGTLLAVTLAWLAAQKRDRALTATLLTTQVDFTHAGDLLVFVDEEQVANVEKHMKEQGYLEAANMATAFNLLRSNDLIWPYVVNNYLRGKKPFPFDILYWNADATRMPAANHSFYLRNCYLNNTLTQGEMEIGGVTLDLRKVTVPIYNLATREDHIAPAKSVLAGSKFFGGPVKYVLAGSGHIAGVVNPPAKHKYQYWTGAEPSGSDVAKWLSHATMHPGSWWPDWIGWIKDHGAETVPARKIGGGKLTPIENAPGSYVKVRD
ncbi:PHA/PHB synthase family protein [Pseudolabrys sp.]|uniref:PHA/PHB synthase family protein n=1 Tax=Pseudolabrys sp. TaxID=1960880 RepID=UPI003D10E232